MERKVREKSPSNNPQDKSSIHKFSLLVDQEDIQQWLIEKVTGKSLSTVKEDLGSASGAA
jgi:hypothetical protein